MIAVDTNILVYAHRNDVIWNDNATACINKLVTGSSTWTIPWPCAHEFIGVVTNKRVYDLPTPLDMAFAQLEAWSSSGKLRYIGESIHHLEELRNLGLAANLSGGMIHDARIAAICLQHGVTELWTADRDFSRYAKLKTRNPLVG